MAGLLFIISAPSGSGKSTLVNELLRVVPKLEFSVSYTTRPPRGSERDGHDYNFVTREQFEAMLARGEFMEHAIVFGQHYYGTAKHYLDDARIHGHDLLLDIDVQGAAQVKTSHPEAISVFVLPPSRKVLEYRLRNRNEGEHGLMEDVIERRLKEASNEIKNYDRYDYIMVNDILEESVEQLKSIVISHRAKSDGHALSPEEQRLQKIAQSCLQTTNQNNARIKEIVNSFNTN
jgi:guanylate kinase